MLPLVVGLDPANQKISKKPDSLWLQIEMEFGKGMFTAVPWNASWALLVQLIANRAANNIHLLLKNFIDLDKSEIEKKRDVFRIEKFILCCLLVQNAGVSAFNFSYKIYSALILILLNSNGAVLQFSWWEKDILCPNGVLGKSYFLPR